MLLNENLTLSHQSSIGTTKPWIGRLENGVEIVWKADSFSDNSDREMAAIAIDQQLGSYFIPPAVQRTLNGIKGFLQVYIQRGKSGPNWDPEHLSLFDYLLTNSVFGFESQGEVTAIIQNKNSCELSVFGNDGEDSAILKIEKATRTSMTYIKESGQRSEVRKLKKAIAFKN